MRPMRLFSLLAAAVTLLPLASWAGKGGPTPPDGHFWFIDQKSNDKIRSLAHIDQAFSEFCLAGHTAFIDATTTPNTRVEFDFSSLGTISNETDTKVDGNFTSISVTLTVFDGPTNIFPILVGPTTVSDAPCSLDGSVRKDGDQLKADLACDLGPLLAAFDIPLSQPDPFNPMGVITQQQILDSITAAWAKKKTIKVNVKTGDVRVFHSGIPDPNSDTSPLVCFTSSDIE